MGKSENVVVEACQQAGVEIVDLDTVEWAATAADLLARVWGEPGTGPVPADFLRAIRLSGNYLTGAVDSEAGLVGVSLGWATPPPVALHSHVTGISPPHQRRGVGRALKWHQRSWALEHDITEVRWTFDPLVRRNAVFNLRVLGATVTGYLENVYGILGDGLNAGSESDRLSVSWQLESAAVTRAAAGDAPEVAAEAHAVLAVGDGGEPVEGAGGAVVTVAIPPDIETLRRGDPGLADSWRRSMREVLGRLLSEGGRVIGLDGEHRYVVSPPEEPRR